jgi:carboxymethylenebutenolidase
MRELTKFEKYLVDEFYDDYREGLLSRRSFIRRVAFITGSMSATIAVMAAAGCQPIELPAPGAAMPEPEEPTATPAPEAETSGAVPGAQSPLSVPEGDPAVVTEMVAFDNQGEEIGGYLAQPAETGLYPAVLICHENRGLTPHIKDVARRYAKEGYVALALDLLWREGGTENNDRDAIPGLLTGAGVERHVSDFAAAFDYVQGLETVDAERIAMTGFCFGGGVTWAAATALPGLRAAAPYYGPAPDLEAVPNIQAAVLGVYAEQDERINAGIEPLRAALDEAGVTYQINIYPGVNHAFHNDTGERYNEEQALQAWQDTLAWFSEHLG